MSKVETIKYGNVAQYATVPARLKKFREENPRASVTPTPTMLEDGSMIIAVRIVKDKSDKASAEAVGSARYTEADLAKSKAYEKLETIATGRALSLLGYLNNGDIASTEEMLEFEGYQEDKLEKAIEAVAVAETGAELMAIQASLPASQQSKLNDAIRARVAELKNAAKK